MFKFLLVAVFLCASTSLKAADFKHDVIYQIVTDRFYDGDSTNNNPSQSSGLYDPTKTNWQAYWGGDLAGIQQKMSYIAGMGVTAIWISPPVDNENVSEGGATVDAYLKSAAQVFQQHKVDGFRVDAIKHATWGWLYSFVNSVYTNADTFTFGEWIADTTSDALYHDLYKFANHSGFSALDFPLYHAIDDVFAYDNGFNEIDSVLSQESANFQQANDLVTFIDNHDRQRFLSINNNRNRLHEALAFLLTSRGVPVIYYGTERYLHNDTNGGNDPYNRPWMASFDTTTTAYQLISKLSALRKANAAISYGTSGQRWISKDVYIFERAFAGSVVLVAINKNENSAQEIGGLNTSLPAGSYGDYLAGGLGGVSISVSGAGGNNPVTTFSLPSHSVAIWTSAPSSASTPTLASVGPDVAQPGVQVTLAGSFSGPNNVNFGSTTASILSSTSNQIVVKVPIMANGKYNVTVAESGGKISNGVPFTVLAAKLIPITFTVNNAVPTNPGDYIFLTGSTVELGSWNTTWDGAVGPLLCPNYPSWFSNVAVPAGQTIQFKFVKIAANGTLTWENGANHTYVVPTDGTGYVSVEWQN